MKPKFLELAAVFFLLNTDSSLQAQDTALQQVEGFDSIVFSHDQQGSGTLTRSRVDFRGQHTGGWTAPWWAPGTMTNNTLVWKTAICPEQKRTLFSLRRFELFNSSRVFERAARQTICQ